MPMWDINDIIKMMSEGKTADEIAQEFADTLNAAIEENEKCCAERCKRKAASELVDCFFSFLETFYPDLDFGINEPGVKDTVLDDFIKTIDEMADLFRSIDKAMKPEVEKKKLTAEDEAFKSFFKLFGL